MVVGKIRRGTLLGAASLSVVIGLGSLPGAATTSSTATTATTTSTTPSTTAADAATSTTTGDDQHRDDGLDDRDHGRHQQFHGPGPHGVDHVHDGRHHVHLLHHRRRWLWRRYGR